MVNTDGLCKTCNELIVQIRTQDMRGLENDINEGNTANVRAKLQSTIEDVNKLSALVSIIEKERSR